MSVIKRRGLWLLLLIVIACVLYIQVLDATPLLDDLPELAHVRHFDDPGDWMGPDCYGFFRPVKNLLFLVLDRVAGSDPRVWHLASLALYVFCILLAARYFRLVFSDSAWALAALYLWALAPTQVSAVVWRSCMNILVMVSCALGCLLCHERASPRRGVGGVLWAAVSALCLFVALLSYEAAVAVLPLVLLHDGHVDRRRLRSMKTWIAYAGLGGVTLVYFVLRLASQGGVTFMNDHIAPMPAWRLTLSSAYLAMYHLALWLWPFGKQVVLGTLIPSPLTDAAVAASWVAVLSLVTIAWALRRRCPILTYGLLWFGVAIVPLCNLVPLFNGPTADYYLVLPSLGLSMALTALVRETCKEARGDGFLRNRRRVARVLLAGMVVWFAWFVVETGAWVAAWRSEEVLFVRTLKARPDTFTARAELARLYSRQGRLEDAEMLARDAVSEAPWHVQGYYALADSLKRQGRHDVAAGVLREAIVRRPKDPVPVVLLAHVQELMGRPSDARRSYHAALALPWNYEYSKVAVINLAGMYYMERQLAEAVKVWEIGVAHDPRVPEFHVTLAMAHAELGDHAKAGEHIEIVEDLGHALPAGLLERISGK